MILNDSPIIIPTGFVVAKYMGSNTWETQEGSIFTAYPYAYHELPERIEVIVVNIEKHRLLLVEIPKDVRDVEWDVHHSDTYPHEERMGLDVVTDKGYHEGVLSSSDFERLGLNIEKLEKVCAVTFDGECAWADSRIPKDDAIAELIKEKTSDHKYFIALQY